VVLAFPLARPLVAFADKPADDVFLGEDFRAVAPAMIQDIQVFS
jgi:hypothetical protein